MVDLHCHILPGIDDGATTLEQSLEMARLAVADGIHTIVATPHLPPHDLARAAAAVRPAVLELQAALDAAGLPLRLLPGAEVPAMPEVLTCLEALLPPEVSGRYLLLEMPFAGHPNYLEKLAFACQVRGVRPVLAHPERSQFVRQHLDVLRRLAERGALLQINADSLLGRTGRAARVLAHRLLREFPGCVVASDAHDPRRRPPLLTPARRAFRHLGGEERFRQVTSDLPENLLAGAPLPDL